MKDETIKILKDTIIQWKKEYDILDSIIDIKDTRIKELKTENKELKSCLQEIKEIAKMDICTNCITQKREDNCQCLADTITQLITKAESEG